MLSKINVSLFIVFIAIILAQVEITYAHNKNHLGLDKYLKVQEYLFTTAPGQGNGGYEGYDQVIQSKIKVYIKITKHPYAEKFFEDKRQVINNLKPYFGDPITKIEEFTVYWDDKKIPIPQNLYSDCYNLNLKTGFYRDDPDSFTWTTVNEKERSILIRCSSFPGLRSYTVYWIINKNGRFQRFIKRYDPFNQ
ncbi:MAG: hypothetical protein NZM04_03995 [Methylacidiphilales bacterium]|nr:hypothetical protein [Candidatus Methylacidiphilales bacterium]